MRDDVLSLFSLIPKFRIIFLTKGKGFSEQGLAGVRAGPRCMGAQADKQFGIPSDLCLSISVQQTQPNISHFTVVIVPSRGCLRGISKSNGSVGGIVKSFNFR